MNGNMRHNFVVRMLEDTSLVINMNCTDPLGRTALLMAIDNENMEILELLLENKVWRDCPKICL